MNKILTAALLTSALFFATAPTAQAADNTPMLRCGPGHGIVYTYRVRVNTVDANMLATDLVGMKCVSGASRYILINVPGEPKFRDENMMKVFGARVTHFLNKLKEKKTASR